MSALRSQGVPYHESGCFTLGQDCICPLGRRQRSRLGTFDSERTRATAWIKRAVLVRFGAPP